MESKAFDPSRLYSVDGYDALYSGKPAIAELILAIKQAREAGLNMLQVFVKRDDEAFADMLCFCQFVERPTSPEVDRLFVKTFIAPKTAEYAPVGPVAANDPRIRRLHR